MTKRDREILGMKLDQRRSQRDVALPRISNNGFQPPDGNGFYGVREVQTIIAGTIDTCITDTVRFHVEAGETDPDKILHDVLDDAQKAMDGVVKRSEKAGQDVWVAGLIGEIEAKHKNLRRQIEIDIHEQKRKGGATELDRQIVWLKNRPLLVYASIAAMAYAFLYTAANGTIDLYRKIWPTEDKATPASSPPNHPSLFEGFQGAAGGVPPPRVAGASEGVPSKAAQGERLSDQVTPAPDSGVGVAATDTP